MNQHLIQQLKHMCVVRRLCTQFLDTDLSFVFNFFFYAIHVVDGRVLSSESYPSLFSDTRIDVRARAVSVRPKNI